MIDGHDVEALCKALHDGSTVINKPTCILAKTLKGKGCPGIFIASVTHQGASSSKFH